MGRVISFHRCNRVLVVCLALRALAETADDWGALATQGTEAYNRGAYDESAKHLTAALAIAEKLGPKDDRLAASLSNLGTTYRAQGRYPEAERLYSRALALREAMFGKDHPQVAIVVNNLATLYHANGAYASAEPLFRRSLGIWERSAEPDEHVATALN